MHDVGTLTQSDREAAEVINQHFFRTLTTEDTTNIPHGTPKNLTTETPTTFEITEELVKKCLLQLKTDKSRWHWLLVRDVSRCLGAIHEVVAKRRLAS